MMQFWRNSSTSVPTWSSSSIYSGTIVEQLQWDCGGIHDCLRIGLIALGFCMTVQSFSSSYIPPPILPLGLHWDCCWIEDWVRIVDYVILLLVLLSLRQFFRSDCSGITYGVVKDCAAGPGSCCNWSSIHVRVSSSYCGGIS